MKIFVMGVPHTLTSPMFSTCAFTMKVWNLCRMLHKRGHEVTHLGVEGSETEGWRNVDVIPHHMWEKLYGHPGSENYNTRRDGPFAGYHALYAANAKAVLLNECQHPKEAIVCCTWGGAQQDACVGVNQYIVESGIGYRATWADFKVFESYAWMHMIYGQTGKFLQDNLKWYDCVIPNYFDPEMFEFKEEKGDYLLYMGRLTSDKGVATAVEVAKRTGNRILLVGQGDPAPFLKDNPHAEYHAPVGVEARKHLMSHARALLCPTEYVEPFGGVAIEAQLSGTPVVCTDWGAFAETVLHGTTGFRCRTLEQFVWAVRNIESLDKKKCRRWAVENFSMDRVVLMYEEYFQQLMGLTTNGWYNVRDYRTELNWLNKKYPE